MRGGGGLHKRTYGKGRGKEILSVARTADLIVVVLDTLNPQHLDIILKELNNIGIRPNQTHGEQHPAKKVMHQENLTF